MILELFKKRRSVRKYKNIPVEKGKIDILVKVALTPPSSRGLNPWEFILFRIPKCL